MEWSTLYKKTSTGAIQEWSIKALTYGSWGEPPEERYGEIVTRWGQIGGEIQETRDIIQAGKNTGKKNATTPVQQAEAEAQSKWEKQLKKGYVKSIAEAEAGQVDAIIEGGISPMLAHKYSEHGGKIVFPAYVSPKLDGIRCIAIVKDGKVTLWTRTRKPINSLPKIVEALERVFAEDNIVLDGELYHNDYRDNFNKIISLVRPDEPVEGNEIVQYHVFDYVSDEPFYHRYKELSDCSQHCGWGCSGPYRGRNEPNLRLVPQGLAASHDEAMQAARIFMAEGFEGAMVKNFNSPYESKRSYHLQKIKTMMDSEFPICGVEEGRGKLAGHVGSFICETAGGLRFNAKLKGELSYLKHLFDHPEEWQGKTLTVQYQNLTPDGLPRFPVGTSLTAKAIRNYE